MDKRERENVGRKGRQTEDKEERAGGGRMGLYVGGVLDGRQVHGRKGLGFFVKSLDE